MDQTATFLIVVVFFWLIGLSFYLYKIASHYQRLVQGTKGQNLAEVLDKILDNFKKSKTDLEGLKEEIQKLASDSKKHVQKVGILRFNPFSDTGGDQSFVLAILDDRNSGIVLTSLHSRGITRWYAKNVKEGKGVHHQLSEEEKKAIKKAHILRQKN